MKADATEPRQYQPLSTRLADTKTKNRTEAMRLVTDMLWEAFGTEGFSWIGFYLVQPGKSDSKSLELVLGPSRDKPACSPIGLHGACGRVFLSRRSLIVTDVAKLGSGYIACDPRDRSEAVVPMLNADGSCWGVLDADSHEVNAFSQYDVVQLHRICAAAELTTNETPPMDIV